LNPLPNRVARTVATDGDGRLFRYENGLEIRTDAPLAPRRDRVLGLGTPQATLMNYMLCRPERLAGRLVFEPFAGSGAIGLMALRAGARHVDLLDKSPRAVRFEKDNASRNGFGAKEVTCIEGSLEDFPPPDAYDLIFANPPFVPTPDAVTGTLTSNAGIEGSLQLEMLLRRLDELLAPRGEAFIYVFQFVREGLPLVLESIERHVTRRPVELTPTQLHPIVADAYFAAYLELFPTHAEGIQHWRADIEARHGVGLGLDHYVIHVAGRGDEPTHCTIADDLEEKYGLGLRLTFDDDRELALGRAFENFVP
jgi:SAM-dependent methyltransferase